jgi:hypothetical protein
MIVVGPTGGRAAGVAGQQAQGSAGESRGLGGGKLYPYNHNQIRAEASNSKGVSAVTALGITQCFLIERVTGRATDAREIRCRAELK